ncbi:delta-60 repeat domain-containing protein [Nocardiopsis prasina]|uniref:delta-60 repeat domain-containing protein n=1 Tax=Nocardiopsis prasina TaxID=2015 RepID=UPI000349D8C6|nr:delta-60 repeat domain-containing protein [Nocardiopsis prasina]
MKPARSFVALTMSSLLLLPLGVATAAPALAAPHEGVVSEQPVQWTPHVLDGTVKDILRIGDTVVVGGEFESVSDADGARTHNRRNLFAFRHGTGELLPGFAPQVDGTVNTLAEGPNGSLIIGGQFQRVNGSASRGIARVDARTGRNVSGFGAKLDDGSVYRLASDGRQVYVGGNFTGVSGQERTGLARIDPATGRVDADFTPTISEQRRGVLRVQELALSPDGRRLAINGTFTKVDGLDRYQIAMIDTAKGAPTTWSTSAYEAECDYSAIHTYMRQMDFAPDGSYFAVVTGGGPEVKPGLCKSTARFENTDAANSDPTWSNLTGGDTLYSVEVTSSAVYVGGHQRWMDNEKGALNPGPGSVAREGIAAVNPDTGRALPWNPGRSRGHGVEALHATSDGLYVGSDTDRLAGEYHARLGMFPAL